MAWLPECVSAAAPPGLEGARRCVAPLPALVGLAGRGGVTRAVRAAAAVGAAAVGGVGVGNTDAVGAAVGVGASLGRLQAMKQQ